MAYYLVRARLKPGVKDELVNRLQAGEFWDMRPFGRALTASLEGARWDAARRQAVWEEEDYCSPPLAMERAQVLDRYFEGIQVTHVQEGEGWGQIEGLPSLWSVQDA